LAVSGDFLTSFPPFNTLEGVIDEALVSAEDGLLECLAIEGLNTDVISSRGRLFGFEVTVGVQDGPSD
jgi:hypothetical protein